MPPALIYQRPATSYPRLFIRDQRPAMIYPHPATIYPDPREVGPQRETVARSRKFSVFQCFPRPTTMCPHNYSRSTTIKSSLGDTILRPRIIKKSWQSALEGRKVWRKIRVYCLSLRFHLFFTELHHQFKNVLTSYQKLLFCRRYRNVTEI